jgi:hypothetical protein
LGLSWTGLAAPAEELSWPSRHAEIESTDIAMLRQIEQRVLPLPLVPGVPRHESLEDYYWEENLPLRYRLDEAVRKFDGGNPRPFRALTIVAGSAGVGKTFVKRGVYNDQVPAEQIWKFDIRELFAELAEEGLAEFKADVFYRDQVINRLLSLTPAGREEFVRRLQQSPAFVVVDSLDEVHPADYLFVLTELEKLALAEDRKFIHVVAFGRPLAFRDYWQDRRSAGLPHGVQGFLLNPPDFRTTGDLLVSSWNYACWKHGLGLVNSDGQPRAMTFPDFQRWCQQGLVATGDFAKVTYKDSCRLPSAAHDELREWTMRHRVVMGVLPNLAGNSILREMVDAQVSSGQSFDERQFMDEYFAKWLERNTKSDDRPSRLKPVHLDVYDKLLEAVAAKYVDEDRVNRLGYFDVVDDDRVVVEHHGEQVSVQVQNLLNRSGLVTLDPMLPATQRYRFEPVWIHRLLLQMHDERNTGEEPVVAVTPSAGP